MKLPHLYPFRYYKLTTHKRVKDIDYVEGAGNSSLFHFIVGKTRKESGNIGFHLKRLSKFKRFFLIHRSCVVNLCAISSIDTDGVVLLKSGKELYCASKRLEQLIMRFPKAGE